ncbi:hypothetical protein [Bradyrhizobium sp. Leo121]|uniref:hypothetical protein n=1 Tax=Bradyrhizobium sp. Leo121 TaxID=1571195 RepID=UPI0010293DD9|nr:hypothetical protein [Bradyrhizobium sp. Leo121]RZN17762.1 hypothetical protein CWO90_37145 [Bradyrhizobium sp. Leo121]
MLKRHHFKVTQTLENRLIEEAKCLREEAKALPPGHERDQKLRKARHDETAAHEEDTDRETVLRHLMEGQYRNPIRIQRRLAQDAAEEIAAELRQRCPERGEIPEQLAAFIGRYGEPSAIRWRCRCGCSLQIRCGVCVCDTLNRHSAERPLPSRATMPAFSNRHRLMRSEETLPGSVS